MPRRSSPIEKAETRRKAMDRHALTRRLERREKWLEKAGISPTLFKQAVDTLVEALGATKLVERGPRAGEEVSDTPTRVRAAGEIAELVRLTVGLTAETQQAPGPPAQAAIVINIPEWLAGPPADAHRPALAQKVAPETGVVNAEPKDEPEAAEPFAVAEF